MIIKTFEGSERLNESQVTGVRLKETQAINKSLTALGDVITALGKNILIKQRINRITFPTEILN